MNDDIVIQWLLEENEPSIRYKTLTELLDYSHDNPDVIAAKNAITNYKNAERIFARRDERGLFPHKAEYYGTWTTFNHLTILAELGIAGGDPRIQPIVDRILTPGDDKCEYFVQKEFDYAYILGEANMGSCGQVKFLSTLVRLGYIDDPRVKRMIDVLLDKGRFDGGYLCKLGFGNIPQMKSVWDILKNKPQINSKYILEAANTKKAILMDKPGQPNKWMTFYMLLAEKERNCL